jgi:hypothetical protein
MAKNYYGHFQKFLIDTTIDDLIKTTMGYKESSTGINAVNECYYNN